MICLDDENFIGCFVNYHFAVYFFSHMTNNAVVKTLPRINPWVKGILNSLRRAFCGVKLTEKRSTVC